MTILELVVHWNGKRRTMILECMLWEKLPANQDCIVSMPDALDNGLIAFAIVVDVKESQSNNCKEFQVFFIGYAPSKQNPVWVSKHVLALHREGFSLVGSDQEYHAASIKESYHAKQPDFQTHSLKRTRDAAAAHASLSSSLLVSVAQDDVIQPCPNTQPHAAVIEKRTRGNGHKKKKKKGKGSHGPRSRRKKKGQCISD
jgi:hypothetical protein